MIFGSYGNYGINGVEKIMRKGMFGFTGKAKDIANFINEEYESDELISIIIDNDNIEQKLKDGSIA